MQPVFQFLDYDDIKGHSLHLHVAHQHRPYSPTGSKRVHDCYPYSSRGSLHKQPPGCQAPYCSIL